MRGSLFFFDYLVWHYSRAFRDIGALWFNFAWFITHFFSIPLLFRTLFSPWKRLSDGYTRDGIEKLAETFVFNLMSRVLGFIVRGIFLVIGLTFLVLLTVLLVAFYFVWLFLPMIALFSFVWGLSLFFV
jgi:hypothetical protein